MTIQQTISKSISLNGVGLHTGAPVSMHLHPAKENHGIAFLRTDVAQFDPLIKASYRNVTETTLGTTISNDDGTFMNTIEHFMAALWGCGVDNILIEVDGPEVPIMDGSSEPFVFALECAGIDKQDAGRNMIEVIKEVVVTEDDKRLSIKPADRFSVNLAIDFDSKVIAKQESLFDTSTLSFKNDICRARTFGFEHEVSQLQSMGLARGGSLDNAIVVGKDKVLNKEGLRFDNEFARHKILDCIGDLYLSGGHLLGEVTAYKTGHALNNKLLHNLFADDSAWRVSQQTA